MPQTVILYNPTPSPAPRPGVPIALLALARMLPPKRFRALVVNATADRQPHRRVMEEARHALLLGITCMTGYQIRDGLLLARRVRDRFPGLPIVWGGYHPSLLPEETLQDPRVDIVVRGQGELPFAALVERLAAGETAQGIPGVVGSRWQATPPTPPESLDAFPFLAWDLIDLAHLPQAAEGGAAVDFYTSQGCPYACRFCAEPAMHGRHRVTLSPRRAVDEIEFLARRGVRAFHLRDTLFFADISWVEEFCAEILRRDLHVCFYNANGRVNTLLRLENKQWEVLEKAGFREILLGVESGHPPALERIAKGIRPEQTVELFERAAHTQIRFWLSVMIGLPGVDAEAEFSDTVGFLRHLVAARPEQVSACYIFAYIPYPGSALYEEAISLGFHPPSRLEDWGRITFDGVRYPWGSNRRRRQASQITRYIMPRILEMEPSRYRIVERICRTLDPLLRRRWETGHFDLFWERAVYAGFNWLRRFRRWPRSGPSRRSGPSPGA